MVFYSLQIYQIYFKGFQPLISLLLWLIDLDWGKFGGKDPTKTQADHNPNPKIIHYSVTVKVMVFYSLQIYQIYFKGFQPLISVLLCLIDLDWGKFGGKDPTKTQADHNPNPKIIHYSVTVKVMGTFCYPHELRSMHSNETVRIF